MFEVKKLKEQRAELLSKMELMTNTVKDGKSFSRDEAKEFDDYFAQSESLQGQIETQERCERVSQLVKPSNNHNQISVSSPQSKTISRLDQEQAFKAWALTASGKTGVSDYQRSCADRMGLNLYSTEYNIKLPQYERAQSNTTTEGGYGHYTGSLFQGVDKALKAYGGMRSFARVIRTANGNPIHWATTDNTARGAVVHTENTDDVANVSITFGKAQIGSFIYSSGVFPVSIELLQDAEFSVSDLIGEVLGEGIARKQNYLATVGSGTTMPYGIVPGCTVGRTSDSASTIDKLDLYRLYFSVDSAYRDGAAFMMSDATLGHLCEVLEDEEGRPIWGAGLNDQPGHSILGKPVIINNDMASVAASAKPIIFGNGQKAYVWRDVSDVQIKVMNETYLTYLAVGFVAFARFDGLTVNANAVKALAMHAAGSS